MRTALHTLAVVLTSVALAAAGPARCVKPVVPATPPCHGMPANTPADQPAMPAGTLAACCPLPAAAAPAQADVPAAALVALPPVVETLETVSEQAERLGVTERPPDRPPGLALFGCYRI